MYNYQMYSQDFDTSLSGRCLSCLGQAQALCYCAALVDIQSINMEFISMSIELLPLPFDSDQQNTNAQFQPSNLPLMPQQLSNDFCITENQFKLIFQENERQSTGVTIEGLPQFELTIPSFEPEVVVNRRRTHDNVAHKRISKHLQTCYRLVTGEKVPKEFAKFNYRVDYSIMILTLLERSGNLNQAYDYFKDSMTLFSADIQIQLENQPEYLNHLKTLIPRYLKAFDLFMCGQLRKSMETVYDYEHMRLRGNFNNAMIFVQEMRQKFGLSF